MNIIENEFEDLESTDTFGTVLIPDNIIAKVEDWSHLDPEDEYSFALLQMIIDDLEFAYVFSGTRTGYYPGASWDQTTFLWWVNKEPLVFTDFQRIREIYDQLGIPYKDTATRFFMADDLENLLNTTAQNAGKRIDLIRIDDIERIIDAPVASSSYGSVFREAICEEEFHDLDDNDQFGEYYLKLIPNNVNNFYEFTYGGLRVQDLMKKGTTPGEKALWLHYPLKRYLINGVPLDEYSSDDLVRIADILEVHSDPITHDIDNISDPNNIYSLIWDIQNTIMYIFERNSELFLRE